MLETQQRRYLPNGPAEHSNSDHFAGLCLTPFIDLPGDHSQRRGCTTVMLVQGCSLLAAA
jgi:hypothetical protein